MPTATFPIEGRKIRIALCGCGRISRNHLSALAALSDEVEINGVCDLDPAARKAASEQAGARGFESLSAMLAGAEFDVVSLCTPSGLHSSQAIQCANAGKHIVTEKPMATRWEDGLRMVRACDEAGVKLFVVKQNRLNPTLQLLKRALEKGRFGRVYMVAVNVFWTRPQAYYDSASWRGTWEFDGGALMNQASHYVDLVDWLVGPVESVQAYTATLARDIQVEDTATVGIKWRSGALGSVNVTMLTYPQNLEGSVSILGEYGTVRVGGVALNEIQVWRFAEQDEDDKLVQASNYDPSNVYGHGHQQYYLNLVKALRGQMTPEVDGREGLKSLELLIAAYKSARDGTRVSLPLSL